MGWLSFTDGAKLIEVGERSAAATLPSLLAQLG
jgi:hypothetical protein